MEKTINEVINWFETLIRSYAGVSEFLFQPIINMNGNSLSLLTLLTFGGISTVLTIAVVKWLL